MGCSRQTEKLDYQGRQPSLVVVTGRPGSGKTTLAHALAQAVPCPVVCRDEIKEGLVQTLGETQTSSQNMQWRASEAFFKVVGTLLKDRVTLIAEAAFQHDLWAQMLEPIRQIAHLRIILCVIDPRLARARCIARGFDDPGRERFHGDHAVRAAREGHELPIEIYNPPHLDVPTLSVDTADGYTPALELIVSFARTASAARPFGR